MGETKWCAILNPYSGSRRLKKDLKQINAVLETLPCSVEQHITQYKGHAIVLAQEAMERGVYNILVFGGDGTMNEVVNGVMSSSLADTSCVTLALVPYGTGNDWARYWQLQRGRKWLKESLRVICSGERRMVDVGSVTVAGHKSYFINSLGAGFDAVVLRYASWIKNHLVGGAWTYVLALFLTLLGYRSKRMQVHCDGMSLIDGERMFTLSLGNGCYTGGGLKQTPKANPTDGKLTCIFVRTLRLKHVPKAASYLFAGKFDAHSRVMSFEAEREVVLSSPHPIEMEIDGVQLPLTHKAEVAIAAQAIGFMIPKQ